MYNNIDPKVIIRGKYRITQLGGELIYRIEKNTKRWFSNERYWKPIPFEHFLRVSVYESSNYGLLCKVVDRLVDEEYQSYLRAERGWRVPLTRCNEIK